MLRYLETNKIAVYGTLVGDSARWGEGYISRLHLPLTMYDNILGKYTLATGGTLDSERGQMCIRDRDIAQAGIGFHPAMIARGARAAEDTPRRGWGRLTYPRSDSRAGNWPGNGHFSAKVGRESGAK